MAGTQRGHDKQTNRPEEHQCGDKHVNADIAEYRGGGIRAHVLDKESAKGVSSHIQHEQPPRYAPALVDKEEQCDYQEVPQ